MLQNLFEKSMQTASLNTQYIVLFKNHRDKSRVGKLAEQLAQKNWKFFLSAYEDATSKAHSHLILDFQQDTPECLRLYAFAQDKVAHLYVNKDFDVGEVSV